MNTTGHVQQLPFESSEMTMRARYVLVGAVVGLLTAVGILFAVSLLHGQSIGLSAANCLVASCVMTLLLSQPVGLSGIVVGATAGSVLGYAFHHRRSAPPG